MKQLVSSSRLRPKHGFSHVLYLILTALIPVVLLALIRLDLPIVAVVMLLLSKWRMFAVRTRYWYSNVLTNSVDIIVGLSYLSFVFSTESFGFQILWTVLYILWLIFLKPRSDTLSVSAQALVGQSVGLVMAGRELIHFHDGFSLWFVTISPEFFFIIAVWLIAYTSARHFLATYEDTKTGSLGTLWAFTAASLAWILSHWFLLYGGYVPQVAVVISILGYGIGTLYYLDQADRLTQRLLRQFVLFMVVGLVIIIALSDWQYHIV